ncbi:hypothetical protein ACPBEI_00395 [Latilactobacillus sakei]
MIDVDRLALTAFRKLGNELNLNDLAYESVNFELDELKEGPLDFVVAIHEVPNKVTVHLFQLETMAFFVVTDQLQSNKFASGVLENGRLRGKDGTTNN